MASDGIAANQILKKFDVRGKNIVITGGCRGLGFTFAYTLAQCGANIAAIDLNEQASADLANLSFGGKYKYYRVNVTDYEALKKTVDHVYKDFGSIDGWYGSCVQFACYTNPWQRSCGRHYQRPSILGTFRERLERYYRRQRTLSYNETMGDTLIILTANRSFLHHPTLRSQNGGAGHRRQYCMHIFHGRPQVTSPADHRCVHRIEICRAGTSETGRSRDG